MELEKRKQLIFSVILIKIQRTLIGILTGRISPTNGDASVFGYSIRDNMESIKNFIGLCAQNNILCKIDSDLLIF